MGAFTSEGVLRYAPRCWFPLAHAEAIEAHPGLRLAALSDSDPAALLHAAERYGVSRTYAEPADMLREIRPALLSVATRTVGRAAIMLDGMDAGVGAFHVEKPLCNSMSELRQLEAAFDVEGRFLTLGTIRRHMSPYRKALAIARSGELGSLLEVQVNFGRGGLYWTHPHSVDLIMMAAGEVLVSSVSARLSNVEMGGNSEIASDPMIEYAAILFDNGIEGRITRTGGCDFILSCERGQVIVEADGRAVVVNSSLNGPYNLRQEHASVITSPEGTLAPMSRLVACLGGDVTAAEENRALRRDILLGQRILFAMVQSHVDGNAAVSIDDVRPDWTVWARTGGRPA